METDEWERVEMMGVITKITKGKFYQKTTCDETDGETENNIF